MLAISSVTLFVTVELIQSQMSYQSNLVYSLSKTTLDYDYSCDQQVYDLNLNLLNNGSKYVSNFEISVTNELCVGAVPPLPNVLNPHQKLSLDLYTTSLNGTITITGNNTVLLIRF